MKKLLFIVLMLTSYASFAQPQFGGQVGGYDNSATKKFWMFKGGEGKVWDSTGNVLLSGIKSLDSSINAKLTSGVPVTFSGHDSTTDSRVGIKLIQNPTITNTSFGISGTLPAFASTPTVNIGTGGYAVSASDSTKYRITHKISESALPTGAATESTLSTLNGKVPSGLTVNSNRLAIYSPDSIRVFATNGFGSGGGGGGTQYAELSTTSPATGTVALGRYMSTPPTLTNGQLYAPMLNSRGTILADVTSSVPNIASPASVPTSGYEVYGLVSTASPSPINNRNAQLSLTEKGGLRTTLVDLSGNYVDASGGGGGGGATVLYDSSGSATSMTVTNLNSLASSNVNGWESDKVSNLTSKAIDYKIFVKLTMSNTAPANEKSVYVYVCPFYYDGTNWFASSQGTTTLPTGTQGTTTIASPNNLRLLGALNYTTQNMVLQDNFLLSTAFGDRMPDGFSIIVINYTGSAVSASSNVISYKPINSKNQ